MSRVFDLDFPRAHGGAVCVAGFRENPEDFFVDEMPGFSFTGSGEHVCVRIEKRELNTHDLIAALAAFSGIEENRVGYFGLKDKHAVTRQWFSLQLPRKEVDFRDFSMHGATVLEQHRHSRKLRRGEHEKNTFLIRLRDVDGQSDAIEQGLQGLKAGAPNYFGEQRFGLGGNNLLEAERLFKRKRGKRLGFRQRMIVSAARAYLFNLVLAERVRLGNWNKLVEGESGSCPLGPLWGRGRLNAAVGLEGLEEAVLAPWAEWCEWLEYCGLSQQRRELVMVPDAFEWYWQGKDLFLAFGLPAGQFATCILRELVQYRVSS